jgi:hypothetical protein
MNLVPKDVKEAGILTMLVSFLAIGMIAGAVGPGAVSCKTAENAIVQGVDEACQVASSQTDAPDWVDFTCSMLDIAGNVIETYTVKVPAASAEQFQAKYVKTSVKLVDGGVR